jgi:hypothetical protein
MPIFTSICTLGKVCKFILQNSYFKVKGGHILSLSVRQAFAHITIDDYNTRKEGILFPNVGTGRMIICIGEIGTVYKLPSLFTAILKGKLSICKLNRSKSCRTNIFVQQLTRGLLFKARLPLTTG